MLKHIGLIVLLTVVAVLAMGYVQDALMWWLSMYDQALSLFANLFSAGTSEDASRKLLALLAPKIATLLAIPFVIGLVPTIIYGLAKRRMLPIFMNIVWITWLVQITAVIVQYKAA